MINDWNLSALKIPKKKREERKKEKNAGAYGEQDEENVVILGAE